MNKRRGLPGRIPGWLSLEWNVARRIVAQPQVHLGRAGRLRLHDRHGLRLLRVCHPVRTAKISLRPRRRRPLARDDFEIGNQTLDGHLLEIGRHVYAADAQNRGRDDERDE